MLPVETGADHGPGARAAGASVVGVRPLRARAVGVEVPVADRGVGVVWR